VANQEPSSTAAPAAASTRYAIDARLSKLQVRAFAAGMLSSFGHNPSISAAEFSGVLSILGGDPAAGTLLVRVNATSLTVAGDVKENDRKEIERVMQSDVLESSTYPEITFSSSRVTAEQTGENQYRVNVSGAMELHGVSRDEEITAYLSLDGEQARAYGEFSLLQSNYAIRPFSFAGGALKLKDELKFSFDFSMSKAAA
jgi:polyisoprenoid-binding protein YceI